MPDTTLVQKTAISFPNLTLGPGNTVSNTGIDQLYDLGDINLKRVIVNKGTAVLSLESTWPGKTKADFIFPKLKDKNGVVFSKIYLLEAGTSNAPYILSDTIDMSDYDFDLTGTNGDLFNNITASLSMSSAEETASFTITNLDTVTLKLEFKDMTPKYAKGYFGEYEISDTVGLSFPELKNISGNLNLDSIKFDLNIENGFDLIAQTTITKLEGSNTGNNNITALNFPLLNQVINLNPASGGLWDHSPSNYLIELNNDNSNIIPFIENLPDSINFGFNIHINPFGNNGAGTDQYFPNSRINLLLDAELPLHIKLDDFTITDTLKVSLDKIDNNLTEGQIKLIYANSFPIGASSKLILLDENNAILDSISGNSNLNSGVYSTSTASTAATIGELIYALNENQIKNLGLSKFMIIAITFNSFNTDFIKINTTDAIDFKLVSDLKLNLSL